MKTKLITFAVVALFGLFSANTAHAQISSGGTPQAPAAKVKFLLSAYPNPTADIIHIKTELPKDAIETVYIDILNAQGQTMIAYNCNDCADASEHIFNVKAFPAGLYYVRVTYKNIVKTIKFMKIDG